MPTMNDSDGVVIYPKSDTPVPLIVAPGSPLGSARGEPTGPAAHVVQFYDDEDRLGNSVAQFIGAGLAAGEPVCVIATDAHRQDLDARLRSQSHDIDGARSTGQLAWLDARETLSRFMVSGMPDRGLFENVVGGVIERIKPGRPTDCVRAYGEMVDLLWREGNKQAALRLEEHWNELARRHPLNLLCTYVMGPFYGTTDEQVFREICNLHTHVDHGAAFPLLEESEAQPPELRPLQQHARSLAKEIEHRKELEGALREALLREQAARQEAERNVHFNQMFAGMLGHDLRNPLSTITVGANYIGRSDGNPKTAKAAKRIMSSAERMARMIDQLLDFTRIRIGGGLVLNPIRFDLDEVFSRVKDELEAAHPESYIALTVEGDTVGEWDHDRMLQMFSNLIGNALHHGVAGSPVRVHASGGSSSVQISVHNDGVVPPDVLPVLFEPFRGNTRYQKKMGLGLGLFITQQIVAAHGGTIAATSTEIDGTMFQLHLPKNTRAALPVPPPQ
jgi:signal transduction histidine kinase